MKSFKFGTRFLVTILALAMTVSVFGQAVTTGSVTGKIVDENGDVVPQAEVTLSSPALQGERTVPANEVGAFTARLLPPGEYTAVVLASGYQAAVITFPVLVGETQRLDVVLYPGEDYAEEITVHGRVSPLESPETRASFDYTTEVEELPIQNRNINVIALNAPNTSFGPNAGQVAISGAPAFDTVVLLDGAEISDPYFGSGTTVYLEDSIQEVQVLTTGISARYGRFQGGVVNAITKSGGNEFSGLLRVEAINEDWNSQTPFGESQVDQIDETYQATLGGYIIPDRLWFFGGYRTIPETATTNTTGLTGEEFVTTANEDRYQIKLRGAVTPSHSIDASYLEFESEIANRAGLPAGDLLAANGKRTDPRDMTSISYQGMFGYNTFIDAIATEKNVAISSGGDPTAGDPIIDAVAFRVYNNHWWDASDPSLRNNQTASLNISHMIDGTPIGSHMIEGGVQWVESTTGGDNRQSATGYNLFAATSTFNPRVEGGEVLFDLIPGQNIQNWVALNLRAQNIVENTAFYLQDSITWNDFRFDVGVRYDDYSSDTTGVQAFDLNFDDFSPRLGVTYNISPGWQVLGSWGKYVGRFNDSWGENATGVSSAPREVYLYTGPEQIGVTRDDIEVILRDLDQYWTLAALVGSPDFPTTYVAQGTSAPYSEEFNFSLRAALPRSSGFASLTYTNREFQNLMTGFVGLACSDFGLCEGNGDFSNVPGGRQVDTTVWANDPRAVRDYEAVALQIDYRPSARMLMGGSWTWSDTRGNYEGEATNQPASGSPFGTFERRRVMQAAVPYGYLNTHVRHRGYAYATYRWGLNRFGNLSTSGIVNYRTGRVWSKTASVPEASTGDYLSSPSSYTYYFDGRGNNEFPSIWSLDVALRYELPIFRDLAPFVKLDVANILDNDELVRWDTTGSAVPVENADGTISHYNWAPAGNCGLNDAPSRDCTRFGRVANETYYQTPRTIELTLGLQF